MVLAPEADGYVISIANRKDKMLSEIVVLDTAKIPQGPVAIIELPFRLRGGIHGSWVMGKDLAEDKELCDMSGVAEELKKEYGPGAHKAKGVNGGVRTNGGA